MKLAIKVTNQSRHLQAHSILLPSQINSPTGKNIKISPKKHTENQAKTNFYFLS
jgi:hypothetical protein